MTMKIRFNIDIAKILKKNTVIIIPVAIALAAALLFVPTYLMRGKIKVSLGESVKVGSEVASAERTVVSSKQYEEAKKYEDIYQADANEIENLARQAGQRELISYKIFPEPNEKSAQIFNEFRKSYASAFAGLTKDMNALDAPTDNEIRKQAGSVDITTDAASRGSPSESSNDKIVELMRKRRSEEVSVYASPKAFSGYAVWDKWEYSGVDSAVKSCWYCQLAYWIHKDVVDTIKYMNQGFSNTTKSSVKRLLNVRFTNSTADNGLELPVYVTKVGNGLCLPWTGRICNDQIDVVHFSLSVIIRADDVLKFMTALCSEKEHTFAGYKDNQKPEKYKHNQITILQSSIVPIDRENAEHKRYYYGENAVVLLNLVCEYDFIRKGYDSVKPRFIQVTDINGVVPGTQPQPPQPRQQQPAPAPQPREQRNRGGEGE